MRILYTILAFMLAAAAPAAAYDITVQNYDITKLGTEPGQVAWSTYTVMVPNNGGGMVGYSTSMDWSIPVLRDVGYTVHRLNQMCGLAGQCSATQNGNGFTLSMPDGWTLTNDHYEGDFATAAADPGGLPSSVAAAWNGAQPTTESPEPDLVSIVRDNMNMGAIMAAIAVVFGGILLIRMMLHSTRYVLRALNESGGSEQPAARGLYDGSNRFFSSEEDSYDANRARHRTEQSIGRIRKAANRAKEYRNNPNAKRGPHNRVRGR